MTKRPLFHILGALKLTTFLFPCTSTHAQAWQLQAPAVRPPARIWTQLTYDLARNRTVLFGGSQVADTWEWDGQTWQQITTAVSPPALAWPAMAYDFVNQDVLLVGDGPSTAPTSDTWSYDGITWTLRNPTTSLPPQKSGSSMAYDWARQRMVLFGGEPGLPSSAETWEWDGLGWQLASPTVSPPPTGHQRMVYDIAGGRIVMFGGHDFQTFGFAQTWTYDGTTWQLESPATTPPGRYGQTMTYDLQRNRVVMFGGSNNTSVLFGDTWEWDGVDWHQVTTSPSPMQRAGGGGAYDIIRDEHVLFGGLTFDDDTWTYGGLTGQANVYGLGCGSPTTNPQIAAIGLPVIGAAFSTSVSGFAPQSQPGLLAVGLSNVQWNGQPLPMSLAPLGAPSCSLLASLDGVLGFVTSLNGDHQTSTSIPNAPGLVGFTFYMQAIVLDPLANALGFGFTPGLEVMVGN